MREIFQDIAGYEGLYQVSNLGRVKSLNYGRTGKEKLLQPILNSHNYWLIRLSKNSVTKTYLLHRLVAQTFIPNPNNLPQVNHIDFNRQNNKVGNLEYCTNQYNTRYSTAKKVGCYKDGKLIKVYDAIIDVNKDGFKNSSVSRCCQNKYGYKSHKGYHWQYLD